MTLAEGEVLDFQRERMRARLLQSWLTPQNWLLYEATLGPLMFPDGEDGEAGEVVPDEEDTPTFNRVVKRELTRPRPTSCHLPQNLKRKASHPAAGVKQQRA